MHDLQDSSFVESCKLSPRASRQTWMLRWGLARMVDAGVALMRLGRSQSQANPKLESEHSQQPCECQLRCSDQEPCAHLGMARAMGADGFGGDPTGQCQMPTLSCKIGPVHLERVWHGMQVPHFDSGVASTALECELARVMDPERQHLFTSDNQLFKSSWFGDFDFVVPVARILNEEKYKELDINGDPFRCKFMEQAITACKAVACDAACVQLDEIFDTSTPEDLKKLVVDKLPCLSETHFNTSVWSQIEFAVWCSALFQKCLFCADMEDRLRATEDKFLLYGEYDSDGAWRVLGGNLFGKALQLCRCALGVDLCKPLKINVEASMKSGEAVEPVAVAGHCS